MPRQARVVVPGFPHHITQRGNNRQDVFFTDEDRVFYLDTLKEQAGEYGLDVIGYCLMTNHIHLIAVPDAEESLAKAVGGTHLHHARYVNRLHGRSGHLWQNRFFSCSLQKRHYLAALRYVEHNPVRARMVRLPWRYPWSSTEAHCEGEDSDGLLVMATWRAWTRPGKWREFLRGRDEEDFAEAIRKRTFNPPAADWAATASSPSSKPSSTGACAPAPAAGRRKRCRRPEGPERGAVIRSPWAFHRASETLEGTV